ncbi:hypothetical protein PHET_08375 [Paragonimus heterotremus]|uniref:Uncharacterized protein n=1 Tax=Paragonimus heterotremus TaxID=100268 RepID=A0A8J4WFW5_9TREM|nr:hypothetical protein PHET_08375 [Paragonimus heterotremus]
MDTNSSSEPDLSVTHSSTGATQMKFDTFSDSAESDTSCIVTHNSETVHIEHTNYEVDKQTLAELSPPLSIGVGYTENRMVAPDAREEDEQSKKVPLKSLSYLSQSSRTDELNRSVTLLTTAMNKPTHDQLRLAGTNANRSSSSCIPIKGVDQQEPNLLVNFNGTSHERQIVTVKKGRSAEGRCPIRGCDGTGHATGLYSYHRRQQANPYIEVRFEINMYTSENQQNSRWIPSPVTASSIANNIWACVSFSGCPLACRNRRKQLKRQGSPTVTRHSDVTSKLPLSSTNRPAYRSVVTQESISTGKRQCSGVVTHPFDTISDVLSGVSFFIPPNLMAAPMLPNNFNQLLAQTGLREHTHFELNGGKLGAPSIPEFSRFPYGVVGTEEGVLSSLSPNTPGITAEDTLLSSATCQPVPPSAYPTMNSLWPKYPKMEYPYSLTTPTCLSQAMTSMNPSTVDDINAQTTSTMKYADTILMGYPNSSLKLPAYSEQFPLPPFPGFAFSSVAEPFPSLHDLPSHQTESDTSSSLLEGAEMCQPIPPAGHSKPVANDSRNKISRNPLNSISSNGLIFSETEMHDHAFYSTVVDSFEVPIDLSIKSRHSAIQARCLTTVRTNRPEKMSAKTNTVCRSKDRSSSFKIGQLCPELLSIETHGCDSYDSTRLNEPQPSGTIPTLSTSDYSYMPKKQPTTPWTSTKTDMENRDNWKATLQYDTSPANFAMQPARKQEKSNWNNTAIESSTYDAHGQAIKESRDQCGFSNHQQRNGRTFTDNERYQQDYSLTNGNPIMLNTVLPKSDQKHRESYPLNRSDMVSEEVMTRGLNSSMAMSNKLTVDCNRNVFLVNRLAKM